MQVCGEVCGRPVVWERLVAARCIHVGQERKTADESEATERNQRKTPAVAPFLGQHAIPNAQGEHRH